MSLFSKDILALDWDHRQLRAVAARVSKGKAVVRRMFQEQLPPEVTGEDPAVFGKWLAQALARNRCRARHTLLAIPRDQVVLKTLLIPAQTPELEIGALVQFQMQKELPFATEEAVIDHTRAGSEPSAPASGAAGLPADSPEPASRPGNGGTEAGDSGSRGRTDPAAGVKPPAQREYLVAATRREIINYYRKVAEAADLDLTHLGLRCFANLQTIQACAPDDVTRRTLLVNVGPELTEIDIIRGGRLLFSRCASVPLNERDDPTEFLNRLTLEVIRSVQAARAAVADLELDGTLVAAPGWLAASIAERLGQRLDIRGTVLEPGRGISLPAEHRQGAGDFSAALGLVLGQTRGAAPPFDFLNPHKPVDLVARRQRRRRLTGIAAAGVVAGAIAGNLAALAIYDWMVTEPAMAMARKLGVDEQAVHAFDKEIYNLGNFQKAAPDWLEEFRKINAMWTAPAGPTTRDEPRSGKDAKDKVKKDNKPVANPSGESKPGLQSQAYLTSFQSRLITSKDSRSGWEIEFTGVSVRKDKDGKLVEGFEVEIRDRLREIYPKANGFQIDPDGPKTLTGGPASNGFPFDIVIRYVTPASK